MGTNMECSSLVHFEVPWLLHTEWAWAVLLAHRVFGSMTLAVMTAWACAMTQVCSVAWAYAAAGAATLGCGLWLLLWVTYLLKPSVRLSELLSFAVHDVAQEQHLVIGLLLTAAGVSELLHAAALASRRRTLCAARAIHSVWFCNMASVGLLFIGHPQRSWGETQRHVVLGLCLVFGAFMLCVEKREVSSPTLVAHRPSPVPRPCCPSPVIRRRFCPPRPPTFVCHPPRIAYNFLRTPPQPIPSRPIHSCPVPSPFNPPPIPLQSPSNSLLSLGTA